jgi:hypothetical protein
MTFRGSLVISSAFVLGAPFGVLISMICVRCRSAVLAKSGMKFSPADEDDPPRGDW